MASECPLTVRLLREIFPQVCNIIIDYFAGNCSIPWSLASLGIHEACFNPDMSLKIGKYTIFRGACEGGHVEMAKAAFPHVNDNITSGEYVHTVVKFGLYDAAIHGNLNIVKMIIAHWHLYVFPLPLVLFIACRERHLNIAKYILSLGPYNDIQSNDFRSDVGIGYQMMRAGINPFNVCLSVVCQRGYHEIVDMLIENGANNCICGRSPRAHAYRDHK